MFNICQFKKVKNYLFSIYDATRLKPSMRRQAYSVSEKLFKVKDRGLVDFNLKIFAMAQQTTVLFLNNLK